MRTKNIKPNPETVKEVMELTQETEFLRSEDIIKIFNISPATLKNWRRDNVIPFYRIGKSYRYRRSEIMEYLENNRNKA